MNKNEFSQEDLHEALRAIDSTLGKCEKSLTKLKENSPQHTLLVRRIKAFQIAAALIERELELVRDTPVFTQPTKKS